MSLGTRIRARREQLNISQGELAEMLNYRDRSTIAKIEGGTNDLTQSKIQAFADCLRTTPQYLLEYTDDPYDYDLDPDSRFVQIPIAQFEGLRETFGENLEAVWHAWEKMQEEALLEHTAPKHSSPLDEIDENYEILARNIKKLSPDKRKQLLDVAKVMFKEEFQD